MFIRKKKLLEIIDMHIASAESVRENYRELAIMRGENFKGSFEDVYGGGIISGLEHLKQEFTDNK